MEVARNNTWLVGEFGQQPGQRARKGSSSPAPTPKGVLGEEKPPHPVLDVGEPDARLSSTSIVAPLADHSSLCVETFFFF